MSSPSSPDSLYSRATQKQLASDFDAAFQDFIAAAQGYLHLSRTASTAASRSQHKESAARCLDRAEKLKALKDAKRAVHIDRFANGEVHGVVPFGTATRTHSL